MHISDAWGLRCIPERKEGKRMRPEYSSRYDFDRIAEGYDKWYETRRGALYDRLEKKAINGFLPPSSGGKKLLEIGCGTGHWSAFFSNKGYHLTGVDISDEDDVSHFLAANTLDRLLFSTDTGKIFQCSVWELPEMSRTAKGRGLLNFLELSRNEQVLNLVTYNKQDEGVEKYLVMATRNGIIKKTDLSAFRNVRRNGLIAIKMQTGDSLVSAEIIDKQDEIILVSKQGKSIRFKNSDLRKMGRSAAGVRGMRLSVGDEVVAMDVINSQKHLLIVTENGYGKRSRIAEYRLQKRGGSGIKAVKVTDKTGQVVFSKMLTAEEDLIVISKKGQVIRSKLGLISVIGRASSGVRVMKLAPGDKVASAICL